MTRPALDITPLPDLAHGQSRTGPVRDQRPVYVDLLPPCNAGCPAGENIQGVDGARQGRRARAGVARADRGEPVPGDPRPRLLPPVRERLQPRRARQRAVDSRGRAVPRRSRARAGVAVRSAAGAERQARARDRRGPERAVGRLPSCAARPRGRDPRRRRRAGRDDALRDSRLPAAAGRARRRGRSDRGARGAVDLRPPGRGPRAERREGAFDAVFVAVGAHLSKRVDIPAADAGPIVDAVSFLRGVAVGRAADDRTSGRRVRRRQHRDGRRARRPAAGGRGGADRLPPHPRADAGPRGGGRGRRARRGADQLAADDHGDRGRRSCRSR